MTIDTEEDGAWDGKYPRHDECTVKNVAYLQSFQNFCNRLGVLPTYLIDFPVANNKESISVLKSFSDQKNCEIGSHVHSWCNPPYEAENNIRNTFLNNLPQDLQLKKLKVLTEAIEDNFSIKPVSYRAGRYGFDASSIPVLEELEYKVDTSIVPFRNVKNVDEPSFGKVQLEPFFLDYKDISHEGNSSILEIPITVEFTRRIPGFLKSIYPDFPDIGFRRLLRKFFDVDLIWLRPSYASLNQMIKLVDSVIASQNTVLNMMFHSSELMPGGSPYNETPEDVSNFLLKIETLIQYISNKYQLDFNTLSGVYNIYRSSQ